MKENNDQPRIQKNKTSPLNSNNCTTIKTAPQQKQMKTLKNLVSTLDKKPCMLMKQTCIRRDSQRERPQTEEDPKEREGDREERVDEENKKGRERWNVGVAWGFDKRKKTKRKRETKVMAGSFNFSFVFSHIKQ